METSFFQAGQLIGIFFMVALFLGIPILLVVSILKYKKQKHKGWLAAAIVSGTLVVIPILLIFYGIYLGIMEVMQENGAKAGVVVSSDSLCQITIPDNWQVVTDLHEDATVQAGSYLRSEYLLVLTDSKLDFAGTLEEYAAVTLENMQANLENPELGEGENAAINGLPAIKTRLTGKVGVINLVYLHAAIEGENAFYQVIGWTVPSQENESMDTLNNAISSFVERASEPTEEISEI